MNKLFSKELWAEKAVFAFYLILLFLALYIHEPWFDEMQAWCIAKTAPLKDLFFILPHYEGHPPFFHLLLAVPARLGIPWEIGLRFLGVICSIVSAYLIIFKAPFARWIRCLLPFTFFLFYQYSVIARPYSLLVLLIILAAICFPKKDEKPVQMVLLLGLLCAFHLFGLAIAGGIAAAWLLEMKGTKTWGDFFRSLRSDKRFYALLVLLCWALLMLCMIAPAADAWASTFRRVMPLWKRALYLLFVLPADAVLTDIYDEVRTLQMQDISAIVLLRTSVIGFLLWSFILYSLQHKYWKYIILPYLFIGGLMFFYCTRHHIGLGILIALFAFWVDFSDKKAKQEPHTVAKKAGRFMLPLIFTVSLSWTVVSLYHDAKYSVFPGKEVISFLNDHNLVDKRIMGTWHSKKYSQPYSASRPDQINVNSFGTEISFYAGRNIIFNFNEGSSKTYRIHKYTGKEYQKRCFAVWREGGLPDVLLGRVNLDKVFEEKNLLSNYVPIYSMSMYDIWKWFVPHRFVENIYVRKDLIEKHNLQNCHRDAVPVEVQM